MQNFGRYDISQFSANKPLTVPVSIGMEYITIINRSAFLLHCDFVGQGVIDFPEQYLEDIPIGSSYRGQLNIIPIAQYNNLVHAPTTFVTINGWEQGEKSQPQSQSLANMITSTLSMTSPQFGFSSAQVLTISATPTNPYGLNLFNPLTSGVIARVWSSLLRPSDIPGTTPKMVTANIMMRTDGIDNNFAVGGIIFAHNIGGVTSLMHVTAFNNTAVPAANSNVGTWNLDTDGWDFLGAPDTIFVNPGQNLLINVQNPVASSNLFALFKWWEQ